MVRRATEALGVRGAHPDEAAVEEQHLSDIALFQRELQERGQVVIESLVHLEDDTGAVRVVGDDQDLVIRLEERHPEELGRHDGGDAELTGLEDIRPGVRVKVPEELSLRRLGLHLDEMGLLVHDLEIAAEVIKALGAPLDLLLEFSGHQ